MKKKYWANYNKITGGFSISMGDHCESDAVIFSKGPFPTLAAAKAQVQEWAEDHIKYVTYTLNKVESLSEENFK